MLQDSTVAIRLTIDGVQVECDTPQEVAVLIRALKQSDKYPKPRAFLSVSPDTKHGPALFRANEPYAFKRSHRQVLDAMKEAYPNGVSSSQLADRVGRTMRSIPIIMVSLQSYVKKRNLIFKDLIVREEPPIGQSGSIYRLTESGLKEFFG